MSVNDRNEARVGVSHFFIEIMGDGELFVFPKESDGTSLSGIEKRFGEGIAVRKPFSTTRKSFFP